MRFFLQTVPPVPISHARFMEHTAAIMIGNYHAAIIHPSVVSREMKVLRNILLTLDAFVAEVHIQVLVRNFNPQFTGCPHHIYGR